MYFSLDLEEAKATASARAALAQEQDPEVRARWLNIVGTSDGEVALAGGQREKQGQHQSTRSNLKYSKGASSGR